MKRGPLYLVLGVLAAVVSVLLLSRPREAPAPEPWDLVIRGALVVDGSGAAPVRGDIAVRGGRIEAVGEVRGRGVDEIDATGLVAAPGFIDVHTHSEGIARLPLAENFVRMGVTTIVTGNCGSSRLELGRFFDELEDTGCAVNVASLVGHNTVRESAMGGNFDREPTAEELARMEGLVARGMEDGAVGLSTGLIYLPGSFAKTDEIVALAKVAAAQGGVYASHMRAETVRIFDALDEFLTVAREARLPAQVSHLKLTGPSAWGRADEVLALLDRARAEGLEVTHDAYAYTASSTTLAQLIPDKAREGTREDFRARLADPAAKAAIMEGMREMRERQGHRDYRYAVIARFGPDRTLEGLTIPEAARRLRGADALEDQIETILEIERRGGGSGVFHGMDEKDLRTFLRHPLTMIASDGGPRPSRPGTDASHPRSFGNNARVLARYVREEKLLTLEEAVRRMTSLPAAAFRLRDRGALRPGAAADIVLFDPDKVNDPATYEAPHRFAEGFREVIVNGTPVLRAGAMTGARPGGPLKRRPAAGASGS